MREKIELIAKVNNVGIEDILANLNIPFPNEGLGFFKTKFCSLRGDANKNGVRLDPCLKDDIDQLICQQLNFSHMRAGFVCGSILHAYVDEDNDVTLILSFYKNLYPNEYEKCLELIEESELTVSFELKVAQEDIVVKADNTRLLTKVQWDGCGLLMEDPPAYPNAIVTNFAQLDSLREQDLMFAKQIKGDQMIQQFEGNHWSAKYINALPDTSFAVIETAYAKGESTDKRARHLPYKDHEGKVNSSHYRYALRQIDKLTPVTDSIIKEELTSIAQNVLNNVDISFNKEDTVDKKANDALLKTLKVAVVTEFGEDAVKDWTDEDYTDEKIQAYRESLVVEADKKGDCGGTPKVGDVGDPKPVKAEVPEVVPEVADVVPEVVPEVAEVVPEVAPEVADVVPEVVPEVADVVPEVVPEVADVVPEVVPEVADAVSAESTNYVTKENTVYDVTYNDDDSMEIVETRVTEETTDGKVTKQEVVVRQTVYAQEVIDAYEAKLVEKDVKIASFEDQVRAELKEELGEYAKEMSDDDLDNEDKVKIARLTKALDIAKTVKVEDVVSVVENVVASKDADEDTSLETGSEGTQDDVKVDVKGYIKKRHAKVVGQHK